MLRQLFPKLKMLELAVVERAVDDAVVAAAALVLLLFDKECRQPCPLSSYSVWVSELKLSDSFFKQQLKKHMALVAEIF
jgi:hypothetical protein